MLGLAGISGWLYTVRKEKLGLDIQGGVRFTYKMNLAELKPEERDRLDVNRLRQILENRVVGRLGVAEGTVQLKLPDQWIIELPGFTDATEAERVLGTTASIEYYHAKTVATDRAPIRKYEVGQQTRFKESPAYEFKLRATGKKILPGTPEYKEMIQSWDNDTSTREVDPILKGADLADAKAQQQGAESYIPLMEFTRSGAEKIERWCRKYQNRGEQLATVLDGVVLSIAPLKDNVILTDNAVIEGRFETKYVTDLVALLRAGALPVSLDKIRSERVDPTIGKFALGQIQNAGMIAFAIIAAFLIVYYVFPGIVALTALLLYILFTLTALKLINATFSLAAIAGFILSVGMAVDANILVFERLKEELRGGKTLQAAIDLGFKRALPAIVDSNACTILTSFVLMVLGTGPVKGFATTLIIGVAISLFTAVTVTRLLLNFLVGSGLGANPKWYGLNRQWFGEKFEAGAAAKPLAIISKRKLFFAISLATIIPGAIAIGMGGIKPNVEFLGGFEAAFAAGNTEITTARIVKNLEAAGISGANVKIGGDPTNKLVYVTVPSKDIQGQSQQASARIAQAAGFKAEDVREFNEVGPIVQKEMVQNAILGVIFSSVLIVVYLAIRFGFALGGFVVGLRFSFAAIGALLHDVLLVVGLAAVFGFLKGWEISGLFVTAMLTVIGFSTHDTIVIFDRIRENLRRHLPGEDIGHLIDKSVTQSIARSINTASTVIVSLVLLIWIGSATPDLSFFNSIMLWGIIAGTYSSIWNASPILYVYDRWIAKRKGEQATLLGIAAHELARMRVLAQEQDRDARARATEEQYGQVRRRRAATPPGQVPLDD